MTGIALAVAPVFAMILLGYVLRRGGFPSFEFWNLNDRLVYWVLMPALFFHQIGTTDLGATPVGVFSAVLYGGFALAMAFGLAAAWALSLDAPVATSVMQGSSRFNTFIALAIAEALHGAEGLRLAVLAAALLVPIVNVATVVAMTLMLRRGAGSVVLSALSDLARNPLILSILAGLAFNAAGLGGMPVIDDLAKLLGAAALPIMLLSVGANLRLRGLSASLPPLAAASIGKLAVCPAAALVLLLILQPGALAAQVVLIYAALPTGVAAYSLARAMGGDAPLMAAMISVQTVLSFLTIPATLTLGHWILAP